MVRKKRQGGKGGEGAEGKGQEKKAEGRTKTPCRTGVDKSQLYSKNTRE